MEEEWKVVEEFPSYEVSTLGKVREISRTFFPSISLIGGRVNIKGEDGKCYSRQINRIVALAFIPNPENHPFVRFKDEDSTNAKADNLFWSAKSKKYAVRYHTKPKKLSTEQVIDIYESKDLLKVIAMKHDITMGAVSSIKSKRSRGKEIENYLKTKKK